MLQQKLEIDSKSSVLAGLAHSIPRPGSGQSKCVEMIENLERMQSESARQFELLELAIFNRSNEAIGT